MQMDIKGSCTASLALQFPDGVLHVLNIGDSGVKIVRENKVASAIMRRVCSLGIAWC